MYVDELQLYETETEVELNQNVINISEMGISGIFLRKNSLQIVDGISFILSDTVPNLFVDSLQVSFMENPENIEC